MKINPFDLPIGGNQPDVLTRRGLFLHTLISVLLGQVPPPAERAALDRAILAVYRSAGITADPATHHRPAPLLRDLAATLQADSDPVAAQLTARLAPWVAGSFSDLFDGPTTTRPDGQLAVWSLRQLPDELCTAFGLTVGEQRMMLAARVGHGLLISGTNRTAFESISSRAEHLMATTDPQFLATLPDSGPHSEADGLSGA